jgi:hypothetical protein
MNAMSIILPSTVKTPTPAALCSRYARTIFSACRISFSVGAKI